jgi:hypothetical protein
MRGREGAIEAGIEVERALKGLNIIMMGASLSE